MAFPSGWPATPPNNTKPIRFFVEGAGSGAFSDNAFLFTTTDTPAKAGYSNTIIIKSTGAALEFSFDGTNVHGKVDAGETLVMRQRYEGGISVRGAGATFRITAW